MIGRIFRIVRTPDHPLVLARRAVLCRLVGIHQRIAANSAGPSATLR